MIISHKDENASDLIREVHEKYSNKLGGFLKKKTKKCRKHAEKKTNKKK